MIRPFLILALLFTLVLPALGATAHEGRASGSDDFGDDTLAVAVTSVASGELLVACVVWDGAVTSGTPSDDKANTWVEGKSQVSGGNNLHGFYAMNVASGTTTVTVVLSGTPTERFRMQIHRVSGAALTDALGQATGQSQTEPGTGTDAVTSGDVTTVTNGEYIFGCTSAAGTGAVFTAGTGFTLGASDSSTADEYQVQSSSGSIAATFTINDEFANPVTMIMTFKEPAAGAVPARRRKIEF